jgi:tripartite-type tricarboxylate transporter receptor subunit TctC
MQRSNRQGVRVVARSLALAATLAAASVAHAQDYPSKAIRLIVPFAAGGMIDTGVRSIADRLGAQLGQQVLVENRAGASGNIGTEAVAKSAPDGYTLLAAFDGTLVINPHISGKLPFDTLRDLAPITKLGDATLILVAHPSVPANTLAELIAKKASLGSLSYGTSGTGSPNHVAGEMLKQQTGLDLVHVPYKGGGQAIGDVVGGQIPLVYTAIATAQQFVRAGKLKALGVSSAKRSAALPDVPTFEEAGLPGFVVDSWIGLLAPAKTPRPIIDRLHREMVAVLQMSEVRERYATLGLVPVGSTPEQFGAQLRSEFERWAKVVKTAGIKAD